MQSDQWGKVLTGIITQMRLPFVALNWRNLGFFGSRRIFSDILRRVYSEEGMSRGNETRYLRSST